MVEDVTLLKIVSVIVVMVGMAALAELDPNNPLDELGIPVDANDFNIFELAAQAPLIQPITQPVAADPAEERYCWFDFFCPDLGFTDEIAKAIERFAISVANFFIAIANGIITLGTVVLLLTVNFVTLFNFAGWTVFQGNFFLLFIGIGLTALLGGAVALWLFKKIQGSIPSIGL